MAPPYQFRQSGDKYQEPRPPGVCRRTCCRKGGEGWNRKTKSTVSTVRHRTSRTKNCVSRNSFLGLGFKMLQQAEKRWIAIFHPEKVRDLFAGVKFTDGLPANQILPDDQQSAA